MARSPSLGADGVYVPRGVIGCAGEIRHGIEMLRHWRGNAEAMGAWLIHIDRYSQRLTELLAEADRAEADRG